MISYDGNRFDGVRKTVPIQSVKIRKLYVRVHIRRERDWLMTGDYLYCEVVPETGG